MQHLIAYLLLLALAASVTTCTPGCGPDADQEPRLTLYISADPGKPFSLSQIATTIYAVGSPQNFLADNKTKSGTAYTPYIASSGTSVSLNLPYSLTADRTQYVFVKDTRRDTLTVNYRRVFTYKDKQCGYWVDVKPPPGFNGDRATTALGARSSLGRVTSVYYEGTYLSKNVFASTYTRSAITVSLFLP